MTLHACAFVVGRAGILVRGQSGSGKSLLVEECLRDAACRGHYGAWVADDRVVLTTAGGALLAAPAPSIAGLRELRYGAVSQVACLARCRLDLVVDLVPSTLLERLPEPQTTCPAAGKGAHIALPCWAVPQREPIHGCHIIQHALLTI